MIRNRVIVILAPLVVVAIIVGAAVWSTLLKPDLPAAERGRRIAEREGCFTCHGPSGLGGVPNPGSETGEVSGFLTSLRDQSTVREWIRDGAPANRMSDPDWQREVEAAVLDMPAFGELLGDDDIELLVAYVLSTGDQLVPEGAEASRGFERAQSLGCFGCHGWGGRLARPNPGSLKGYIPSWDGPDFDHLVANRSEFEQWVRNGISDRIAGSGFTSEYVNRANVKMPAYDTYLRPGDVDALWSYVQWLRQQDGGR